VRSRWAALAVVFLTRLSMGFQFQSIASIAPFLIDEFRQSYAQLGGLLGLYYTVYYLGMAVTQPLAGFLRDRSGSPAAPVFFAATLMAATVLGLGAFRLVQRRGPVTAGE
jgi:MFS family permease